MVKLVRITPLLIGSKLPNKRDLFSKHSENKAGHFVSRKAKKKLDFVDTITGCMTTRTDYEILKWRRNIKLDLVIQRYEDKFKNQEVSVLDMVVYISKYPKFSYALKLLKKWLIKQHIKVHSYCWVRDVGFIEFKPHFQCVLVTTRIEKGVFKKIFTLKDNDNIRVTLAHSLEKSVNYLKGKEIYGDYKEKSHSVTISKRTKSIKNETTNKKTAIKKIQNFL
jgi:hypothetical protein